MKSKKEEINKYDTERRKDLDNYKKVLTNLKDYMDEINELNGFYGAHPIEDGGLIKKFQGPSDLKKWASRTLSKKTLAGIDGSQIVPGKKYEVPIGLGHAVCIIDNHNSNERDLKKDTRLVTPSDFTNSGFFTSSKEFVYFIRDKIENNLASNFIQRKIENSYCLLDGALVLSHANRKKEELKKRYLNNIKGLLKKSRDNKIPVIGFIETSFSRDISTMIEKIDSGPKNNNKIHDSLLLSELLEEGERTSVFMCKRDDRSNINQKAVLADYGNFQDQIGFFYICFSKGNCCRVEFPLWCYEKGMVDDLAELLRVEAYKGNGYLSIIEKAHNKAVLDNKDKEFFEKVVDKTVGLNKSVKETKKSLGNKNVHWRNNRNIGLR
ncbi:MAG: NurA 5'-3' nuclease [Candidatus Methanohalarchaeum thermophilum]|uniref:NurA 5'-3' nuclease n=1 Tax=Methanohalarchaeum thermophilum TaxID=1903181 RepID=A0A1Q6DUP2_METT1|nr:MAG: NurA 5'-3' nuclease [Candidatus Methanohalarchaeum thermophilum]